MNFLIFFLSTFVVILYANAQYQGYYDDSAYYGYRYPNYPVAGGRTPNLGHDSRLFWSYLTSTTTTTTTTTTTCTVSTALACVGRRKRFLEGDDDSIEPSPVNKVEVTQIADMDSTRNERKADSQFWRGDFDYYPPYELRSTIGQRTPFPSYNPYMRQPVIVADPRFLLYYAFTTTITSTTTTTSRSTPICSQASGFNQC